MPRGDVNPLTHQHGVVRTQEHFLNWPIVGNGGGSGGHRKIGGGTPARRSTDTVAHQGPATVTGNLPAVLVLGPPSNRRRATNIHMHEEEVPQVLRARHGPLLVLGGGIPYGRPWAHLDGDKIRSVQVRPAVRSDRGVIWALNEIPHVGATADPSFPLPLTPREVPPTEFPDLADVPDSFLSTGGNFLVVEEDRQIVGMGGYKRVGEDSAQVLRVRVHPAVRRRGVARHLMEAIERSAFAEGVRRMVVETAQNQPEAISFYEAIGYRQTGTETRPEWTWTLVWFERNLQQGP